VSSTSFVRRVLGSALALAAGFGPVVAQSEAIKALPLPKAGEIAPALEHVEWLQLDAASDPGKGGTQPEIAKLRGQVVVLATFGHFCDSCVRAGIPLANAIRASNPGDVRVIGLTSVWQEETRDALLAKARALGIEHSIAVGDFTGTWTPYLDMDEQDNLTWAYVITRSGGILWAGDPSAKTADFLAAIARARSQPPAEPLPASLAPELAPAVAQYVEGDYPGCEATLAALTKKLGAKPALQKAREDAARLSALIEGTRKLLMDELERSVGDDHPERFARAAYHVKRAFPKGPCSDRLGQLDMVMSLQRPHGVTCRKWSDWLELAAARPANFPAQKDKAGAKFAKELGKYLKLEGAVGAEQARKWLEQFAAAG
jgi:hypothetical protein